MLGNVRVKSYESRDYSNLSRLKLSSNSPKYLKCETKMAMRREPKSRRLSFTIDTISHWIPAPLPCYPYHEVTSDTQILIGRKDQTLLPTRAVRTPKRQVLRAVTNSSTAWRFRVARPERRNRQRNHAALHETRRDGTYIRVLSSHTRSLQLTPSAVAIPKPARGPVIVTNEISGLTRVTHWRNTLA